MKTIIHWCDKIQIFSFNTLVVLTLFTKRFINYQMIEVMISFSNNLISKGISCLLAPEKNVRIHSVSNPSSLPDALKEKQPHIVILDFFVLVNFLSDVPEGTRILLLDTGCGEENINYAFITKNISGLLTINADEKLLIKAIRSVCESQLWIDRKSTKNLISFLTELAKLRNLTDREQEILCMIGRGMDDRMISEVLEINERTVKFHIDNLKRKCGINARWELAMLSMQFSECIGTRN